MAKARHTYAVRLAVEGGNKVKAELVSVGESGERSLKKIDAAGTKASRGLSNLTDRAKTLRVGMRALGGALAGVAAVGGLATLIDRSISAADAVGKTADKIGVGVEALQELRYAAIINNKFLCGGTAEKHESAQDGTVKSGTSIQSGVPRGELNVCLDSQAL